MQQTWTAIKNLACDSPTEPQASYHLDAVELHVLSVLPYPVNVTVHGTAVTAVDAISALVFYEDYLYSDVASLS